MEKQLYFEQIDQAYNRLTGKALEERLLAAEKLYGREHGECQAALSHAEMARQALEGRP